MIFLQLRIIVFNFLGVLVDSLSQGWLADIGLCGLIFNRVLVIDIVNARLLEPAACPPVRMYGMERRLFFSFALGHGIFPEQQVLLMLQMVLLEPFLMLILLLRFLSGLIDIIN